MRRSFRHIALKVVFLSLFTFHLSPSLSPSLAQHYVGPVFSGGLVQTVDDMPETQSRISGGGEIGVAYQYQHRHLLLHTGLNYTLQCPVQSVDSQWLSHSMIDTRGVAVTYRGLLANRSDQLFLHQLSIPFMIGGNWSGVYLLAGLKFSVALSAQARETAGLRTAGDYNGRYYEWFEDMPNHGYHDFEPVSSCQNLPLSTSASANSFSNSASANSFSNSASANSFSNSAAANSLSSTLGALSRFDLRLAAELGYTFRLNIHPSHYNPRMNPHSAFAPAPLLRVGVFAEYGMINMLSGSSSLPSPAPLPSSPLGGGQEGHPRTTTDWSQYLSVSMNHIYASDEAAKARANMLFFGIRITLLFPVATPADQFKCRCTGYWQ